MTEKELNQYRAMINEINDMNNRISVIMKYKDVPCAAISGTNLTNTPIHFEEPEPDPDIVTSRENLITELIRHREVQKNLLIKKLLEIEQYIAGINNSEIRTIFRMYFIDGISQLQISRFMGYDQSVISRKIRGYINLHRKHELK
jgi:hypothetical protein